MIDKEQALALERGLFGERRANLVWERELKQNVNVYRSQTRLCAILLGSRESKWDCSLTDTGHCGKLTGLIELR